MRSPCTVVHKIMEDITQQYLERSHLQKFCDTRYNKSAEMDLSEVLEEEVKQLNKQMLQDITEKTNKIHVSFLFWGPVTNLLQDLCQILCATPLSHRYNGWPELGVKLGLKQNEVDSIKNTPLMQQDPVYVMFLACSQEANATIAHIYYALSEIGRSDVICRTYENLLNFHKKILLRFTFPKGDGILKAPGIPEVPHILRNLETINQEPEQIDDSDESRVKTKLWKKIVLLTYVPDKSGFIQKVVEEFRKKINGKSIGVLTLEEHRTKVLENFNITQLFYASAHYIIPIVTTDYLTYLAGSDNIENNMDGYYARYIYSNMMTDYLKSGCKNKKVRCIIRDDDLKEVQKHYFFQPLFQSWTRESDIAKMAKQIIRGKI